MILRLFVYIYIFFGLCAWLVMFMCKCFHAKSLDRCFIMNFDIAASVKFRFIEVHSWGSYLTLACTRFLWIIFWSFKFRMSSISKTLHICFEGVSFFVIFCQLWGFKKCLENSSFDTTCRWYLWAIYWIIIDLSGLHVAALRLTCHCMSWKITEDICLIMSNVRHLCGCGKWSSLVPCPSPALSFQSIAVRSTCMICQTPWQPFGNKGRHSQAPHINCIPIPRSYTYIFLKNNCINPAYLIYIYMGNGWVYLFSQIPLLTKRSNVQWAMGK